MFSVISNRIRFATLLTAILVFVVAPPSAAPPQAASSDEHDHAGHQHAETFSEALVELKGFRDTIRDAFAAKKPDDAHDALHEIGHVLESLPALAKAAGMDDAGIATVKEQVTKLFDFYGTIDDAMHAGKEPNYDKGSEIDAALEVLAGLAK